MQNLVLNAIHMIIVSLSNANVRPVLIHFLVSELTIHVLIAKYMYVLVKVSGDKSMSWRRGGGLLHENSCWVCVARKDHFFDQQKSL